MSRRVIVLVGGWGIDPSFGISCLSERYPEDVCHYLCPTQSIHRNIPGNVDVLIGYSLGGRLVQCLPVVETIPEVHLLAPALSIVKEDELGGKIPRRTLKAMLASFKKAPLKQLRMFLDFIGFAGIPNRLPYTLDALCWGLEILMHSDVVERAQRYPTLVGEQDPLVDGACLKRISPESVTVIPGMGHGLSELLWEI